MRVPALSSISDGVLICGRLATVAFILVFGITVGFVHFPRFQQGRQREVTRSILQRAALVGLCAILIEIPGLIDLYMKSEGNFWRWVFSMYSVLNYYTLALLSLPVWLWIIRSQPLFRCLVLGIAYWSIGALILRYWPPGPLGWAELVRLHLVSGPFAYFQMSGAALVAVPLGIYLKRHVESRAWGNYVVKLVAFGVLLAVIGFWLGLYSGELSTRALVEGTVKSPPRIWYWALFGGVTLLVLAALVTAHKKLPRFTVAMALVALFGQASLPIYTAHKWVLPSINWLDRLVVIEGVGRIGVGFGLFGVFCAVVMYYYHRKNVARLRSPTVVTPKSAALSL